MKNIAQTIALLALLSSSATSSAWAAGPAQSVSVKMGYFNLAQVKASFPGSATATSMEERAKEMLRRDVEKANTELAEMQKQNKSKEEIEKRSKELSTEVKAKQEALSNLLMSNSADANRTIANAVLAVAKEKGLDLVVDGSGVFAGGDKFVSTGEDVTEAVLKRLVPATASH
jgi:Skp family chaperone for outer membrane proteins